MKILTHLGDWPISNWNIDCKNNLTGIEIYARTPLKRMMWESYWLWKRIETIRLQAKETVHMHCTLIDKVIFHDGAG